MKFNNILRVLCACAAVTLFSATVKAQDPGLYYNYATNIPVQSISGANNSTNAVGTSSTNYWASFPVSEYASFQLQLSLKAMASATSTVQVYGYRSCGLSKFETTPSYSTLVTLNGTTEVTTIHDITNLYGTASYKFVIGNTNASVAVTNVTAVNRFKAPLQSTKSR